MYSPAEGAQRLWTRDGGYSRRVVSVKEGGDYVAGDTEYELDDLGSGDEITLYVETVQESGSPGDQQIVLAVSIDGGVENIHTLRITALPRVRIAYSGATDVDLVGLRLSPQYTDGRHAVGYQSA